MRLPGVRIENRLTVRQAAELRKNPQPALQPVRANPHGSFDEKCAWMKARQAAKEAAMILRSSRSYGK